MTETRSCKLFGGSFKPYLIYKIKRQRNMLILSLILNALNFPVFSALVFTGGTVGFDEFAFIFTVICGAALLICSAAGPFFAFGHYIRKEQTDTVYSLPMSYKQRFWGDLLSGYITSTAAFIPAGLLSVVMFAINDAKYDISMELGIPAAWGIVLTLFFVFTFAYLISAVVVSCCGKTVTAVVFTAAAYFAEWCIFAGLGVSFLSGILVMSFDAPMKIISSLAQPVGLVIFTVKSFMDGNPISDYYDVVSGMRNEDLAVLKPAVVTAYILMAAGLIYLAYRIGKKRAAEKIGNRVVNGGFLKWTETALAAGVALFLISMLYQTIDDASGTIMIITSFICSAAVFAVCEVLRFPKRREVPKSFLRYGITFAGSVGLFFLLRQTGSFGMRYYVPDPENVIGMTVYTDPNEYSAAREMRMFGGLTFTEKEDIKRFQELNRKFVKDYCGYLNSPFEMWDRYDYGTGYRVSYKLKNGKELKYIYHIRSPYLDIEKTEEIRERLRNDLQSLTSYTKAMTDFLWQYTIKGCAAELNGSENTLNVSADKTEEFVKIFRGDIDEDHSFGTDIGTVTFYPEINGNIRAVSFPIPEGFNRTKEFLNDPENLSEQNAADPALYEIFLEFPYGNGSYGEIEFNMYLSDNNTDRGWFTELLRSKDDGVYADTGSVRIEVYSVMEDKTYYIPNDRLSQAAAFIFRCSKSALKQKQ